MVSSAPLHPFGATFVIWDLAQLAFVAVEDDPGDGVPALVAVEPDVTVYLTKDANAATLRQIAELAPARRSP